MPKQWMSDECSAGGKRPTEPRVNIRFATPKLRIAMPLTVSRCHGSVPCPSVTRRSHPSDLRRLRSCGTSNFPGRPHADGDAHAD
jgi:hypothetical protein